MFVPDDLVSSCFSGSKRAWLILLGLGSVTLVVKGLMAQRKRNPRGLPLPPGPRGLPFLGSALDLTSGKSWETYRKWAGMYGDVVYGEAMGSRFLVLNSLEAINDLLEKRGPNYSDRPHTPALEILGMQWNWGLSDYTPSMKANRRVFHQSFTAPEIPKYFPMVEQQTMTYLQRLAQNSTGNVCEITKYFFGSLVVQMSYGVSDETSAKKMIDGGEAVVRAFGEILVPGAFLVDIFPFLRYIPSWFPGAGWKKRLADLSVLSHNVYRDNFEDSKARLQRGEQSEHSSILSQLIPSEDDPSYAEKEELARANAFVVYIAGVDTQTSSINALILALAMYPEVLERCQQELDNVVGHCCLPKMNDTPNLPYIQAVIKELLRWHSVVPLSLPHAVREDDEYRGYFIPKGTVIFANSWSIMHDPENFESPMEFRPERYFKDGKLSLSSALDPEMAAFGYGRRICPGRHMANATLPYVAASLVAVFDIKPAKDENGHDIPLKYDTEPVIVTKTLPFKVAITPRSAQHAALVVDV